MREIQSCDLLVGRGISLENRPAGKREVTILSRELWSELCSELGAELPWHTRRANLLLEGVDLAKTEGCILSIGPVRLKIHGQTHGCALMDELHDGLRKAMATDFRAGLHGEVLTGGTISVSDTVSVCP